MFCGCALSCVPRIRSCAAAPVSAWAPAFAEPRYCQAPASTSSSAAPASSRGRIKERMEISWGGADG